MSNSPKMSSKAKSWLSETIRGLRDRLIKDLNDGLESTYRLSIAASRADLDQEKTRKRARLDDWLNEQARAGNRGQKETVEAAKLRHRNRAVLQVASTWLNRLVVLGQLEALGLVRVPVFTGGWNSKGFREFREFGPAISAEGDESYAFLLNLVFDELALDLPGLFGPTGLVDLIGMPMATLRHVIETLQADHLGAEEKLGLWRDDTLLGWIYQFWNDPEREELDEKIRNGGKIENHEIAAKTQLFTDRYMVEWLVSNSLGQIWLDMCALHGWTPEVVASGTLETLEKRRAEWRAKREAGEVDEEALMPLETPLEERWKYYVPRAESGAPQAGGIPQRLSELKLLDPACGSGHFLVIAFDFLAELYLEEARHRGESISAAEVGRSILENNLHGLDIDPRAVQIAAAALWLKLKAFAPKSELGRLNLVASNLGLASLPADDPALLELLTLVEAETGISQDLTRQLVETLKGADHLGSLLKVGQAVDKALEAQAPLLTGGALTSLDEARSALLSRLEGFVAHHSRSEDLGLRLRGEQLASGVRFVRLVRESQYHLVVGNPPYQGSGRLTDSKYIDRHYTVGKENLAAAFILRACELNIPDGLSALLSIKGWMHIGSYEKFRTHILQNYSLSLLCDLDRGAFEDIAAGPGGVAVAIPVLRTSLPTKGDLTAVVRPSQAKDISGRGLYERKKAGLLCGLGRYDFHPHHLRAIPGQPLIYWWDQQFLDRYASVQRIADVSPARQGSATADNTRFLRLPWEVKASRLAFQRQSESVAKGYQWVPYVKGSAGISWFEPINSAIKWAPALLELYLFPRSFPKNEAYNFRPGIAFTAIGSSFTARAHRFRSVFGHMGSSVFPEDIPGTLCLMNSSTAKYVLESLNPGVHFEVGDVNRLPLFPIESAEQIVAVLEKAFAQHEQARETSVEFIKPGPTAWVYAQDWAQRAVDRPAGAPLPEYAPVEVAESEKDHLSYQLGLALGRFDANGIAERAPEGALPHGILFLSASGGPDSLEHPAAAALREQGQYLRTKFLADDHLKRYEKRPIYFPLSSEKKSYVAWCSIHRWSDQTLFVLLADHLIPEQQRLMAELADAGNSLNQGDRKAQIAATKRHGELIELLGELQSFIQMVDQIAERGAPVVGKTELEVQPAFKMDLDDGVMINSAALSPLLLPQGWKDPKNWWGELCEAKGKKDYDWSHLAARYFPSRVDAKCQVDPSLAVAHGVFWKYHPEKAAQWELRLQSHAELGPEFRLDEPGSDEYRAAFVAAFPEKMEQLRAAETQRRERKGGPAAESDQGELDFEEEEEEE